MKIDRLIGILSVLLQQERVTAPYLAEKFEVSRRTINRDIEALCKAGIPIVTVQGRSGGISIMDGYRMDRTLLTSGDMQAILAGLRSLDSVSGTNRYQRLMEKLSVGSLDVLASNNHILINLSSWNKTSLAPKIELIQAAIERRERISFTYYAPKGESGRTIEPYYLIFQWASWYVWGWCCMRKDFRLFKLNRITKLRDTGERFEPISAPVPDLSAEHVFPIALEAKIRLDAGMKWRLVEEYGPDSFEVQEDGSLLVFRGFADRDSLFGWLLSLGEHAELLEPENLRREFQKTAERIRKKYGGQTDDHTKTY